MNKDEIIAGICGKSRRGTEQFLSPLRPKESPVPLSRHIPQAVRDSVYVRDGGQCTFVSAGGVRCKATHDLEFHHVQPFGKNGCHEEGNLTLLCRAHNLHQAEKDYGAEVLALKVGVCPKKCDLDMMVGASDNDRMRAVRAPRRIGGVSYAAAGEALGRSSPACPPAFPR